RHNQFRVFKLRQSASTLGCSFEAHAGQDHVFNINQISWLVYGGRSVLSHLNDGGAGGRQLIGGCGNDDAADLDLTHIGTQSSGGPSAAAVPQKITCRRVSSFGQDFRIDHEHHAVGR